MLVGVLRLRAELRTLVTLALPLSLAQLAQNAMGFVDTLMVGRLGPTSLAGLALGASTLSTVYIILMAILLAVAPLVAQAVGARRQEEPGQVAAQALLLALLLSVPGILLFLFIEPVFIALGLPNSSVGPATAYLKAVAPGLPFALGFVALRGLLEGHGDARPILYMALAGVALNVFLNDMFIFGRYGLPAFGVVGVGLTTASVYILMFVAAALLVRKKYRQHAVFAQVRKLDGRRMREILRIGLPISAMLGLEVSTFTITAFLMGGFGDNVLAGHQIAAQSASMMFMIPLGIATATAVLVGQAAGRKDPAGVLRAGRLGIGLAALFMCLSALLFYLAPRFVIGLYVDIDLEQNLELVRYATSFLMIAAMFQVVDGIQVTAQGALRGLKDTRVPMVMTLVAYWLVGMALGLVLTYVVGIGPRGLWFGLVAGLGTAAVLLVIRFGRLSGRIASSGWLDMVAGAAIEPVPAQDGKG